MLVLSRKKNETIVVNEEIRIEILQIKGNQIRVGIMAPHDVRIRRGELTPWSEVETTWKLPPKTGTDATAESVVLFEVAHTG